MTGRNRYYKIAEISMFTAVIAALSQIALPTPFGIPLTLQTFAVSLCGYLLGTKFSAISVLIYIFIGGVGFPVFSNFGGGVGKLVGITGGFIWGFLFLAGFCGINYLKIKKYQRILYGILGLVICHFLGVLQFSFVSGNSVSKSFMLASLPFLLKDIVSVIAAFFLSAFVTKALKR